MNEIISSIIDIDSSAEVRIREAEKQKLKIISDAKAEEERIVREAVENAKKELEAAEAKQLSEANEKIAALEAEKNSKISAMNTAFTKNSEKWSSEIFKAVISQ
ncbi:MAG: hypothetical protein ACI4KF_12695 [Huintestinicola sp.]